MDKVIFLDIDGVLCTHRAIIATHDGGVSPRAIDPIAVSMLNRLATETDSGIVLSSTWKKLGSLTPELLRAIGIRAPLFNDWRTPDLAGPRGNEIQFWLDKYPVITNYVIFDDIETMLPHQESHLVRTDSYDGMSYQNFKDAYKILMGIDFNDPNLLNP